MQNQTLKIEPNNKRIFTNSIYLYVRLVIVLFISLYTTRILLNALGVEDYGLYNVVCGFVGLFAFINTSMANGIQRFFNYEISQRGNEGAINVYNTAIRIQLIAVFFIIVFAETIGLWYINNELVIPDGRLVAANWIYQFSILSFLFIILQVPFNALVIAYERMNIYAFVSVIDALLKLGIALLICKSDSDRLILYGALILGINIFNLILYLYYCKSRFRHIYLKRSHDKSLFRSIFSFSGWNLLGSFSYVVKTQGINLLLNNFFGTIVNAANAITNQVVYALQSFAINLVVAFTPQLTQAWATENYERTERLMNSMSKMSYILFCAMAVPVIFEIDYILSLWLGENIPDYTAQFCVLALCAGGISSLHTPITQMVHATGKIRNYHLTVSLFMCSIIPIAWFVLRSGANPNSVFWVTIVITIVNQIASMFILYTIFSFNVKRYLIDVIGCCVSYSVMASIIPYFICSSQSPSFLRLVLTCLGSMLPICFIRLILNQDEWKTLMTFIRKL